MRMGTREFCVEASRTLSTTFHMDTQSKTNLLHSAIGIATEVGELKNAINIHGEIKDKVNFLEELGDCDWYVTIPYRELFLPTDRTINTDRFAHLNVLGLVRELDELSVAYLDLFKKYSFYGKEIDSTKVSEIIFTIEDILYELALRAGSTLEQARFVVISKLRVRFPDKFTSENAENRNLTAERQELEKV